MSVISWRCCSVKLDMMIRKRLDEKGKPRTVYLIETLTTHDDGRDENEVTGMTQSDVT